METNNNLNFDYGTAYEAVAFKIRDVCGVIRHVTFVYTQYNQQDCKSLIVPFWILRMRIDVLSKIRQVLN